MRYHYNINSSNPKLHCKNSINFFNKIQSIIYFSIVPVSSFNYSSCFYSISLRRVNNIMLINWSIDWRLILIILLTWISWSLCIAWWLLWRITWSLSIAWLLWRIAWSLSVACWLLWRITWSLFIVLGNLLVRTLHFFFFFF